MIYLWFNTCSLKSQVFRKRESFQKILKVTLQRDLLFAKANQLKAASNKDFVLVISYVVRPIMLPPHPWSSRYRLSDTVFSNKERTRHGKLSNKFDRCRSFSSYVFFLGGKVTPPTQRGFNETYTRKALTPKPKQR